MRVTLLSASTVTVWRSKGRASVLSGRRAVSWPVRMSRSRPEEDEEDGEDYRWACPTRQPCLRKTTAKITGCCFSCLLVVLTALKSHDPLLWRRYRHTGVTTNDSDPTLLKLDLLHEYDSPHFDCLTRKHLDLICLIFLQLHITIYKMRVSGIVMVIKLGLHQSLSLCQLWAQVW